MNVARIAKPLAGEHVVAVAPRPAPFVDASWRSRLNLFTGRTLSDTALRAEQQSRAGRIATLGQALSPGVIHGLDVSLAREGTATFLNVAPGAGLAVTGEDVLVPHALHVNLADLLPAEVSADLRAGILVLSPVEVLVFGRSDRTDPCEIDEAEIALADEQWVDAAELKFLSWNAAWSDGEVLTELSAARNALAYRIFQREARQAADEHQPWEAVGVPLALLGMNGSTVVYLDRFAVVRAGGLPRARTHLLRVPEQRAGTHFLWQARLQQLVDHVADLQAAGTPISSMIGVLATLPPVGLLPREAVAFDLGTSRPEMRRALPVQSRFFGGPFSVWVAPLPLEQLESVLERSASLAPLSAAAPERVLVLAPVPQAVYEPELFIEEAVDPAFQAALDSFTTKRNDLLGRRGFIRDVIRILTSATDGPEAVPTYPPLEPDEPEVAAITTDEDSYDLELTESGVLAPRLIAELHIFLGGLNVLSDTELAQLNGFGLDAFAKNMKARVDGANDVVDFAFLKVHSDIYRVRQLMLGNTAGSRLAASPALASIALGESAAAVRADINSFYLGLKGQLPLTTQPTPPTEGPGGSSPVGEASTRALAAPAAAASPEAPRLTAAVSAKIAEAFVPDLSETSLSVEHAIGAGALVGGRLVGARSSGVASDESARLKALGTAFVGQPRPSERIQVQAAPPLLGDGAYDFRTVSVIERLADPVAQEAKAHAVSNRYEALSMLVRLFTDGLNIGTVKVQGLPARRVGEKDVVSGDTAAPFSYDAHGLPIRLSAALGEVATRAILDTLLNDPPPQQSSEATFFAEALRVLENNIATLRGVEARLAGYQSVVDHCGDTLDATRATIAKASSRLAVIDSDLDQTRHQITTTKALLADETRRIDAINARRHAVISEHVRFLAYMRPRIAEALFDVPSLALNPGIAEAPVPACLASHAPPPAELDRMIQLLREAPVAWFRSVGATVDQLDRVELLRGTLQSAQFRARNFTVAAAGSPGGALTFVQTRSSAPLAISVARATDAQHAIISAHRLELAQIDLGSFGTLGWRETRQRFVRIVSLGDLIEANHGRAPVTKSAASELAQIRDIAACLHARISAVLPVIRLLWAERLTQYETAAALGNLSALPRWAAIDPETGQPEIPFSERKQIQALVDWLYGRVDPGNAEAVAWMHDLVRVCILLASHAPVDEIVSGRVPVASAVSPGGSLPVEIDPDRIRIGMKVMFFDNQKLLAHGLVEDIVGTQALARVIETAAPSVSLAADAKARFADADSLFTPSFFRR